MRLYEEGFKARFYGKVYHVAIVDKNLKIYYSNKVFIHNWKIFILRDILPY